MKSQEFLFSDTAWYFKTLTGIGKVITCCRVTFAFGRWWVEVLGKVRGKLQLHWQCPQTARNGTHCATQMVVNFFSQIILKIAGDKLCLISHRSQKFCNHWLETETKGECGLNKVNPDHPFSAFVWGRHIEFGGKTCDQTVPCCD